MKKFILAIISGIASVIAAIFYALIYIERNVVFRYTGIVLPALRAARKIRRQQLQEQLDAQHQTS